jgi:hypothetical protein
MAGSRQAVARRVFYGWWVALSSFVIVLLSTGLSMIFADVRVAGGRGFGEVA